MLRKAFLMLVLSFAVVGVSSGVMAATYDIDTTHSSIGFSVKHMVVGTTKGEFSQYKGTITYDPDDLEHSGADVTIQTESIDTNLEARDKHLRSDDFLAAEKFPQILFHAEKFEKTDDGLMLTGDLTIRGITREISFPVEISGPVVSPYGANVIGLSAQTTINRMDYGVVWSKSLDNGGLMVGKDVKISIEIEAHQKTE